MTKPTAAESTEVMAPMPTWKTPAEPSWERAREYCQGIRRCVEDIIALGLELTALRRQFIAQGKGGGGDVKSAAARNHFGGGVDEVIGIRPKSSRETDEQYAERGWQAKVYAELKISHQTAIELMKRARYCCMIRDIAKGEDVRYLDSQNEVHEVKAAPELTTLAEQALEGISTGQISPSRAWAGITGEGARRKIGQGTKRDEVDHYENIVTGLKKLRTSLKHWKSLEPGQRAEIECLWGEVASKLPDTWTN